ncbi:putative Ca2+/H+ antiporter (TMEM165/GDT1 family) [Jatrophihabitans sp. GAS493]|uniref:TMEM165/GDT1 family protein n=1 Tax=Jatrophihabitans sp. GAS493 TaxID=1907575 RepID=UPI000BB93836|nr:TMEM165/GDT1 family protein [Jatrophihabitans sp. GAS493]SOD70974.1 putative Ca2+/H+ antiporter (TMEM165/GDT1 family) [Jatrophihabitans sp. GAS493]
MNFAVVAVVFGIVLIAELPDKTMFASLMLGTRFAARWVFIGAAAAFLVHVIIAVTAGSLLGLLPHRILEFIIAALFLAGAIFMWRESRSKEEGEEEAAAAKPGNGTAWAAIASSFGVIFIGEWGDITQIATANLAAKYHDALSVAVGATLGLWTAALIAITAGKTLLRIISVQLLHRVGAVIFLGFAVFSLVEAFRS